MSTAPETDTLRSSAVDDYAKAIYALEHRAAKNVFLIYQQFAG
jgi:hypothetical protein